jgi:hypothetical protein
MSLLEGKLVDIAGSSFWASSTLSPSLFLGMRRHYCTTWIPLSFYAFDLPKNLRQAVTITILPCPRNDARLFVNDEQ